MAEGVVASPRLRRDPPTIRMLRLQETMVIPTLQMDRSPLSPTRRNLYPHSSVASPQERLMGRHLSSPLIVTNLIVSKVKVVGTIARPNVGAMPQSLLFLPSGASRRLSPLRKHRRQAPYLCANRANLQTRTRIQSAATVYEAQRRRRSDPHLLTTIAPAPEAPPHYCRGCSR